MAKNLRLITVLTLLVAFGLAGLLPASGSWSCPDGTICVYTPGRGYHCLGERCQMACCAAKKPAHCSGCCGHGTTPAATTSARSPGRTIGTPAHCRYHQARQVEIAWVRTNPTPELPWGAAAVLPAPLKPPVAGRFRERLAPIRGSPPSTHFTPSSSPRAPPGPHCA